MNKTNSHFTDLMITKDASYNADFIFGIDMDNLFIDNSAYSALIEGMTNVAKIQISIFLRARCYREFQKEARKNTNNALF